MPSILRWSIQLSYIASLVLAAEKRPSLAYKDCQKKTDNPLDGCPEGTIYVSNEDATADFPTIQDAVHSLPNDTTPYVILIGAGIYTEQINVTRSGPVTLLGQSDRPWNGEVYSNVTYNENPQNEVQVYWNAANSATYPDNLYTSVLAVGPTYNATQTGAGPTGYPVPADTPFGCSDFRAYNIDFRNEFAPRAAGPAHAVAVGYANTGFYSCGFYSYQDTVYIGKKGNSVMYDSVIAGQTDFLYGFGTLFVDKSTLLLRSCGGGITAWKGTNTTFPNKYGVYIADTNIIATNTTVLQNYKGKCSLGRPWNSLHRSLMMNSYLDEAALPAGYTTWNGGNFDKNTTMALYNMRGPGNNEQAQRDGNVTLVWDREQALPYARPLSVFMTAEGEQPNVDWIDPVVNVGCKKSQS
ncbi:unnamed protein product [Clonostachys rosea f. rosea IK726]|uniref:pectinesterase n=2 Tax=Bionectria ochroleuca TaxID=29856 RepID=A0A0B7K1C8_BIOOC|nr:unnamed protein product [Clonostachys rosea f. rosea IK726]